MGSILFKAFSISKRISAADVTVTVSEFVTVDGLVVAVVTGETDRDSVAAANGR